MDAPAGVVESRGVGAPVGFDQVLRINEKRRAISLGQYFKADAIETQNVLVICRRHRLVLRHGV